MWCVFPREGFKMTCKRCGSYAINPHSYGRQSNTDLDLCDVCYWRKRAEDLSTQVNVVIDACPMGRPDGTSAFDNALDWIMWARRMFNAHEKK